MRDTRVFFTVIFVAYLSYHNVEAPPLIRTQQDFNALELHKTCERVGEYFRPAYDVNAICKKAVQGATGGECDLLTVWLGNAHFTATLALCKNANDVGLACAGVMPLLKIESIAVLPYVNNMCIVDQMTVWTAPQNWIVDGSTSSSSSSSTHPRN